MTGGFSCKLTTINNLQLIYTQRKRERDIDIYIYANFIKFQSNFLHLAAFRAFRSILDDHLVGTEMERCRILLGRFWFRAVSVTMCSIRCFVFVSVISCDCA